MIHIAAQPESSARPHNLPADEDPNPSAPSQEANVDVRGHLLYSSANGCLRHSSHVTARGEPCVVSAWVRMRKNPFSWTKSTALWERSSRAGFSGSVSRRLLVGRCSENSAPDQTRFLITARRTDPWGQSQPEHVEIDVHHGFSSLPAHEEALGRRGI